MPTLTILAAALGSLVILLGLILALRAWRFKPTKNKALQLTRLNDLLSPSGFAYQPQGDFFYALMDGWQRSMGYCRLYDEAAPFFNMIMDCEPIPFSYDGKRWLIQLWKGQYGITTGAEIGVYATDRPDVASDKFTGTFYDSIPDSERLRLAFVLRQNGKVLMKRRALHWWLTGFTLGTFSQPEALSLDARIGFPTVAMRDAFIAALMAAGYQRNEFRLRGKTVTVHFTTPHTPQPATQTGPQRLITQELNKSNCTLYQTVTTPYADTLDKLEYLQQLAPELFDFLIHSLYAKGVFDAFGWLKPILPEPPKRHPGGRCDPWDHCMPCEPCPPCHNPCDC